MFGTSGSLAYASFSGWMPGNLLILWKYPPFPPEIDMTLLPTDSLTLAKLLVVSCCLTIANSSLAQEFTRSTIPLKSGGAMTSIQSQGQRVAYLSKGLSGEDRARTAGVSDAMNFGSSGARQETGFVQARSSSSNSFYRRAQQSNAQGNGRNGVADQKYPYPASAGSANAGVNSGFDAPFRNAPSASISTENSRADLRFDRSGMGQRPSGALGDTRQTSQNRNERVAQLPQPPTQLPAVQLPPALPDPAAALPAAGPSLGAAANCNCGPNYANPAANYAVGYQGYQPQPQAANSVPALNIQMPPGFASNLANANCCPPQTPQTVQASPAVGGYGGYGGYSGYQLQPGIGAPQFGGANNPWWSSFLTGSGQYTPLIQFRNMPPGTYLGQGVIGQPTAYVDGQPIRNLLRYVSP